MSRINGTRSRSDLQWRARLHNRTRIREMREQMQQAAPKSKPPAKKKAVKG